MKYLVSDLHLLGDMVRSANALDERMQWATLRQKQPGFLSAVEEVRLDPRCIAAHTFCVLYCGLALERAELMTPQCSPSYTEDEFRELASQVAQEDESIGKRGIAYPKRIERHVLAFSEFDSEDAGWLAMMISAFLLAMEGCLETRGANAPSITAAEKSGTRIPDDHGDA